MELGMNYRAEIPEFESFGLGLLTDPDPVDIPLSHMEDAVRAVDKVMDLTFQDRLKIGLHFPSGDFDPDSERNL